jgi:hypothetical protein
VPTPVALFAYNRPDHLRRTVATLAANELAAETDLIIFSDGPRRERDKPGVESVRAFVSGIQGFRSLEIHLQPRNLGLAQSIISGVTAVCERFGRVIVLEDDLETSRFFLRYMNEALDLYENEPAVASIHGYTFPVRSELPETFFIRGTDCWGWATWKRAWDILNPDGTALLQELERRQLTHAFNLSGTVPNTQMLRDRIAGGAQWEVLWHASAFLANMVTLFPAKSLVHNIGTDGTGVHCGPNRLLDVSVATRPIRLEKIAIREDDSARTAFQDFHRHNTPLRKVWALIRNESRLRTAWALIRKIAPDASAQTLSKRLPGDGID